MVLASTYEEICTWLPTLLVSYFESSSLDLYIFLQALCSTPPASDNVIRCSNSTEDLQGLHQYIPCLPDSKAALSDILKNQEMFEYFWCELTPQLVNCPNKVMVLLQHNGPARQCTLLVH